MTYSFDADNDRDGLSLILLHGDISVLTEWGIKIYETAVVGDP